MRTACASVRSTAHLAEIRSAWPPQVADDVTLGTMLAMAVVSYAGKKNLAPSHNVQGKHHSRHMPWEGQHAAMRTTIAMRRVGGAST